MSFKRRDTEPSLFPDFTNQPTILRADTTGCLGESESDSTTSSFNHLKKNLFKSNIAASGASSDLHNYFRTDFDSDLEVDSSSDVGVSINSVVLEQIETNDLENATGEDAKFKYLSAYARKYKQHVIRNHTYEANLNPGGESIALHRLSDTSVFDLSQLDDYRRYMRSTEIDLALHKKYDRVRQHEHRDSHSGTSILNVLPHKKLESYVGNFEDDHKLSQTKASKKNRPWLPTEWPRKSKKACELSVKSTSSTTDRDNISDQTRAGTTGTTPNMLQRKLKVRHLQMISFGGTLGVGLFLNSGKAINMAGGFGTLLAFIICGIIVLATMISFCEMVTFVSVVDGVSGLSSRFVDDSFGFAVGWLYFFSFAFGLTGEIVASVIMLSYYPDLKILENKASCAGFVTLFLLLILASNSIDVRVFGEVEYISSFIKLLGCLMMIIVMIAMNLGAFNDNKDIGFKYWNHGASDFADGLIFGLFRPTFNLHDDGTTVSGVGGDTGRFLSLLVAVLVVSYAYSGTEIVCIAACEAQNPRKALPSATRRVFWRILIFYCLSAFVVSLNVYAGDPRLLRYYSGSTGVSEDQFASNIAIKYVGGANCYDSTKIFAGFGTGSQSPWIVALQSIKLCHFSSAVNGFLVFFAVSCGNAQLYVSSRTLYSLALQRKAPKVFTYCNSQGIPYNAVFLSGAFGLISYLCVSEQATNVFQTLTSIISSSGIIVWFAMCLSFVRFYYGMKKRPDIISRDDIAYPYKSYFQPYSAMIGLVGSGLILLLMGFVVFLKDEWDTLFFFASYGTLMVFAILYFAHKIVVGTRIPSLETLDFDTGRREMDRYIWDGGKEYNRKSIKDLAHKWLSFMA
ncbi:Amino acid permease/ SLC12A domain-containing protein [[Candida] zeylanoides]